MKSFKLKVINPSENVFFTYENKHSRIRTALYNVAEIIERKGWEDNFIIEVSK